MTQRELALAAPQKTMRAVIFTTLLAGQRAKHENELRRLGFDVDTRDFPRTYNLHAYDVVFVVREHAENRDAGNAESAASMAGKPWFRLTKKTSHATWDAVRAYAQKMGLNAVEDKDSHPPSFAAGSFAEALAAHAAKRGDAAEWQQLAEEYERSAVSATAQAKEATAKYEAAEAEIKELRKRLQEGLTDATVTVTQRDAMRRDLALAKGEAERLSKEVAALRDSTKALIRDRDDAVARSMRTKKDYDRALAERDQQSASVRRLQEEIKTAREELAELRANGKNDKELEAANEKVAELQRKLTSSGEMLRVARHSRDEAQNAVKGLQDEIDRLNRELTSTKKVSISQHVSVPAGKRLVPANIVEIADKLWALVDADVLDVDDAWEKLIAQLKGD